MCALASGYGQRFVVYEVTILVRLFHILFNPQAIFHHRVPLDVFVGDVFRVEKDVDELGHALRREAVPKLGVDVGVG